MNITNIHLKKVDEENNAADSADITYKTWNETTKSFDEHTLKCDEAPNPSFVKGLQEGAKHVCALCELPATQAKEIVVTGLSLSHDKHGHARLSIKAWKHLEENGPLILNTPTAPVTAEKEDAHTVSDACAKCGGIPLFSTTFLSCLLTPSIPSEITPHASQAKPEKGRSF